VGEAGLGEVDVALFEDVPRELAGGGPVVGGRVAVGGEEDELEGVGEGDDGEVVGGGEGLGEVAAVRWRGL
jgi:hypothetical protein